MYVIQHQQFIPQTEFLAIPPTHWVRAWEEFNAPLNKIYRVAQKISHYHESSLNPIK